ncbi:YbdD/YjiX family protein [Corallococcus exiguus]|nr:YbdD/YjiX family protein [Corallococcus exiguus]NRD54535.1 YbdD/YjiX family protein [Corallococcus exiguus]NRD66501.1 YbdD/YjiX family protein [Corallococcus exiguus]RKH25155.1 DUF466 domain-containing protein [Corallococcus sp. CA041A]RKI09858.1 DUF466 domain-containing protein [Corallococcus sp. AB030]
MVSGHRVHVQSAGRVGGPAVVPAGGLRTYVAHMRRHHPDRPVMTYAEFFNDRLQARYRAGGGRCC